MTMYGLSSFRYIAQSRGAGMESLCSINNRTWRSFSVHIWPVLDDVEVSDHDETSTVIGVADGGEDFVAFSISCWSGRGPGN